MTSLTDKINPIDNTTVVTSLSFISICMALIVFIKKFPPLNPTLTTVINYIVSNNNFIWYKRINFLYRYCKNFLSKNRRGFLNEIYCIFIRNCIIWNIRYVGYISLLKG